jgi:hypothetical protein
MRAGHPVAASTAPATATYSGGKARTGVGAGALHAAASSVAATVIAP